MDLECMSGKGKSCKNRFGVPIQVGVRGGLEGNMGDSELPNITGSLGGKIRIDAGLMDRKWNPAAVTLGYTRKQRLLSEGNVGDSGTNNVYARFGRYSEGKAPTNDWAKGDPSFKYGVQGNYDITNNTVDNIGVYGQYKGFNSSMGINPNTGKPNFKLGLSHTFQTGGVKTHKSGGDKSNYSAAIKASRKGTQLNFLDKPVSQSSHKMTYSKSNGKYYVYPTLFQDDRGNWYERSGAAAQKEAKKKGEVYEFDTEQEAINWAGKDAPWKSGEYKKGGIRKNKEYVSKHKTGGQNSSMEETAAEYNARIKKEYEDRVAQHKINPIDRRPRWVHTDGTTVDYSVGEHRYKYSVKKGNKLVAVDEFGYDRGGMGPFKPPVYKKVEEIKPVIKKEKEKKKKLEFLKLEVKTPWLVPEVKAPDIVKALPFHIVNSINENGEFKVGPTAKGRGGNRDMSEDGSHNLQIRLPNGRDGERNVISTKQLNQYVQDGLIKKHKRGKYSIVKSKKSMKGGVRKYQEGGANVTAVPQDKDNYILNAGMLPEVDIEEKDTRSWLKKNYQKYISPVGHGVLDVAGMVPLFGEAADGINAVWYTAEGNYVDAALSSAAMIPFAGWAATGTKWTKNTIKAMDKVTPGGGEMYQQLKYLQEVNPKLAAELGIRNKKQIKKMLTNDPSSAQRIIDNANTGKVFDGKVASTTTKVGTNTAEVTGEVTDKVYTKSAFGPNSRTHPMRGGHLYDDIAGEYTWLDDASKISENVAAPFNPKFNKSGNMISFD